MIVINHNPETVSSDYDESDALYFEELSTERVLDIMSHEGASDVVVSMGGQAAQNLVPSLRRALFYSQTAYSKTPSSVHILGTNPESIERAEDRTKHSQLLDSIGVLQPRWVDSSSEAEVKLFADRVGFPVLVRPSFVLAGASMRVIYTHNDLSVYLDDRSNMFSALRTKSSSLPRTLTVSEFVEQGREIDVDAVARKGKLVAVAVTEHIEDVGVHSGDATMVYPPISLAFRVITECEIIAEKIAAELEISGPFNLQVILTPASRLKVIETNLRASRSMPFVAHATKVDFLREAALAILDLPSSRSEVFRTSVGMKAGETSVRRSFTVKRSVFSFKRLPGADVLRGVTMKSTGEVAVSSSSIHTALLDALDAAGAPFPMPPAGLRHSCTIGPALSTCKSSSLAEVSICLDTGGSRC